MIFLKRIFESIKLMFNPPPKPKYGIYVGGRLVCEAVSVADAEKIIADTFNSTADFHTKNKGSHHRKRQVKQRLREKMNIKKIKGR
jgi:hypothetical protein